MESNFRRHASIFLPLVLGATITSAIAAVSGLEPLKDAVKKLPAEQRITLETIRKIAIGVESFAIDQEHYPGPTDGVQDISSLKRELVPLYLKSSDWDDGWGRRMRYLSNGKTYVIISFGSDGIPDEDGWDTTKFDAEGLDKRLCGGPVEGTKRDVVLMDGVFCQYPQGL